MSLCDTCCLEFEPVFLLGELLIGSRRYLFGSSTLCEQPIKTWRQTTVPSGIRIQMQQVKTHPDLCFHNHFVFTYVLPVYNLDLKLTTIMTPMILFLFFLSLTAIPPVSLTSSCCFFFHSKLFNISANTQNKKIKCKTLMFCLRAKLGRDSEMMVILKIHLVHILQENIFYKFLQFVYSIL